MDIAAPAVRRRYPQIERAPDLDRDTLLREYLSRNRPVVFSVESEAWRARWTPEALAERHGRCEVETEEVEEVYVGERAHRMRPLASLVEAMRAGDPTLRWKGLEFLSRVPGMRDEVEASPPPHRAHLPASAHALRDTLWLAPRATTSSLHHDGDYDNLNLQISGQKLFVLIPPPRHVALHAHGSAESPVNPFVPDLARFPRFAEVDPLEATLAPGDVLFLPKYWWHCVYAALPSVNLSTHFRWDGELSPRRVLRGAPLVRRSLTIAAAALKRRGLNRLADASRRVWCAAYARLVPRVMAQPRCELLDP
jgi:ribosomal protein L16 Arg81 hydroxylase